MKIKKGDKVIVISGKDKGTSGPVARVIKEQGRVLVEGVNMRKKHHRARRRGEKGQIVEMAYPIHISNVQLIDPQTGARTRVGYKTEGGKKVRIARKSGNTL